MTMPQDDCESEEYQKFIYEMSKHCMADDGPCDGCLAGGICDGWPKLKLSDEPQRDSTETDELDYL